MKELTFNQLRKANLKRLPLFRNKKGDFAHSEPDGSDWLLSQWSNAVCGEIGEVSQVLLQIIASQGMAANLIKKIERGDFILEEKRDELGKELADVAIYLDILAFRVGIDLGSAIAYKFNEVSDRVGCDIKL